MFEFLDSDLEALIRAKGVVLSPSDVKAYMSMLLQALDACHKHWVLHRDIKPNNMLISRDGEHVLGIMIEAGLDLDLNTCHDLGLQLVFKMHGAYCHSHETAVM